MTSLDILIRLLDDANRRLSHAEADLDEARAVNEGLKLSLPRTGAPYAGDEGNAAATLADFLSGNLLAGVKLYRALTGAGLKDSKNVVEGILAKRKGVDA